MDRRKFLTITAAGALTVSGVPIAGVSAMPALERCVLPRLPGRLGHSTSVLRLGARYRGAYPSEDDAAFLRRAVRTNEEAADDADRVRGALDRRVQDDFAAGRTVVVDGWVLAQTEARQCALYSIHYGSGA